MSWCDSAAKTGKNIAVWWDMKDCPVPEGIDAHRVRPSIEGALKEQGYSGPVSITAYGDQKQTPDRLLRALSSTGVAVVHIRSESTCAVMYKDMVKWREDNPPPATMMIITNQMLDVFHWDLARLQQRTSYDLFLAYSVEPLARLFVYTRKNWLWKNILLGTTASVTSSSSDAVFYCKSCSLECLSLKSFKKHLSTEEHAIQEVLHPQPKQLISVTSKWGKNYAATPEYATAKIHVWWDMFDCPIPDGYDAHRVRPSLEGAFKELGYSGPVSITAFGDYKKTPKSHLHALSSTGIDVAHVIPGLGLGFKCRMATLGVRRLDTRHTPWLFMAIAMLNKKSEQRRSTCVPRMAMRGSGVLEIATGRHSPWRSKRSPFKTKASGNVSHGHFCRVALG
ncbi:hypothetical protein Bca101_088119 [Brassica carinata]